MSPHILRHTYATHQLEQGVDIRFIQQGVGMKAFKPHKGIRRFRS